YQVGSPAMLLGNMFLPDAGMPIKRSERRRTRLAVWLPEPLTVATWRLKSLTTRCLPAASCCCWTARSVGDIHEALTMKSLRDITIDGSTWPLELWQDNQLSITCGPLGLVVPTRYLPSTS